MISSKLVYFFLVLLLAIFSVAYSGTVPILFIITLLLVTFVTALWSLIARQGISLRIKTGEMEEDRRIPYQLCIKNTSLFPITYCSISLRCNNLFDGRSTKQRAFFTVPPRGEQEMAGLLQTDSAGVYTLTCSKCFFTDWFRLFRRKIKASPPVDFYIWPHIYSIHADLITIPEEDLSESKYSPHRIGAIPGDFLGVRDYREGDRLQHVHWKLTGKTGDLVVKEFSLPLKNAISILLDFSEAEDIAQRNALLDTAATLSGFFIERQAEHELCFLKENHLCRFSIRGQDQLYDALREILSRPPDNRPGQPALTAYPQRTANKHLICVSSDETILDNPVLIDYPLPSALMLVGGQRAHVTFQGENLHVVMVDAADIQKSLTGLEL